MDSQTLMLIILIVVLIFIYKVMSSVGTKMANQEKEVDEYVAQKLMLKVFFDRGKKSAMADLGEFDKTGVMRIVMFLTEPPKNEIERQAEGKWMDAGPAVVRITKDTDEVISWKYIK